MSIPHLKICMLTRRRIRDMKIMFAEHNEKYAL
ncbi:hypothetical protein T03_14253 [Trichinella britovi]|uniref:Uncharacterized protein n=1 Tax=Trichinella britovi TaxID=45882 RepID=A0A0V1ALJ8_TRIBR|nr:hypothetical protein T03_14253 [Trichinella britovi]